MPDAERRKCSMKTKSSLVLLLVATIFGGVGCAAPKDGRSHGPGWGTFNPLGTPWVHPHPVVATDNYNTSFSHERRIVGEVGLAPGADFYDGGQSHLTPSQQPPRPYGNSYTTRSSASGSYQRSHVSRVDSYDRVNCNGQVTRDVVVTESGNMNSQSGTTYERQWTSGQSGPVHYAPTPTGRYIQGNPPGFRILQGITTPR